MSDDLISRQAAIDVLSLGKEMLCRVLDDMDVVGTEREKYSWGLGLIESNINDIEELPSAEPKRGEWEVVDEIEPRRYGCNRCKRLSWDMSNFCPNCGADMRGER